MNSTEVLDILEEYYMQPVLPRSRRGRVRPSPWAFLRELRMGTGKVRRSKSKGQPKSIRQRIDAWVYNTWPSQREAVAFEVKCSRADFLNEIANPRKRQAALEVSNRFYFITPPGIATPLEIPEECGYMVVYPDGRLDCIIEAPLREIPDFPMHFISAIIRRVAREERRSNRLDKSNDTL